jgi:hypothetical protein
MDYAIQSVLFFSIIKLVIFLFGIVIFRIKWIKKKLKKMSSPLKSKFRVIKFQNMIDENNKLVLWQLISGWDNDQ